MSSLLYLTDEDFNVIRGEKGNLLCHSIPGMALILFYHKNCPNCVHLFPIFKTLPNVLSGCQFGIVNIGVQRKVIDMSKQTVMPLQHVPLVLLYINGKPYFKYTGDYDLEKIKGFIFEVQHKLQSKQQFYKKNNNQQPQQQDLHFKENAKTGIPEYSLGSPLYGECDVSYLMDKDAYGKVN